MDILSFSKTDLIKSLHKNNLLKPFIKSTISSKEIEDVILSDEDFNKQKENFFRTYNISNEKDKEDFLKKNSMKEAQLLEQISTQAKLKTYLLKNFKAKAESRFLDRKLHLDSVIYSLIRVKDPYKADELYMQIYEKESNFVELAHHSEGPEKSTKGLVGPIALNQADPALVEILRSIKPGEVHEPIRVNEWFLIVQLEKYFSAKLDVQIELKMMMELFDIWLEDESSKILKDVVEKINSMNTEVPVL